MFYFVFQSTFKPAEMETRTDYSDDIKTIKRIMEESSRFLSLSGLSGIFAGILAFLGGFAVHFLMLQNQDKTALKYEVASVALIILILALAGSFYFSIRKARRKGHKVWTPVSRRLLLSLFIPLISGGFFILILYIENQWQLIVPAMLIFYGLSLVNAGKFTYSEIFYLGLAELITGFLAAVFKESFILFWILGFGFLHIVYGFIMYRKYQG
jgi:hypothetical protein